MVTLYNVISQDGFIADESGGEDFIPEEIWNDFTELCKQYDTVVMGRKTYEAIQTYSPELIKEFEDLPIKKVVVSSNKNLLLKSGYLLAHNPQNALDYGSNILLTSGPTLNTSFASEKLIDRVIFNQLSIKIGSGLKPFNLEVPLNEELEEERDGRVLKSYSIVK